MYVLGVDINFDHKEKLRRMLYEYKGKATYVCFPNANVIIEANDNKKYKDILNNSMFNICDGTAPMLYARLFTRKKFCKYTGPDYMMDVFNENNIQKSHFFLGSTQHVLNKLKNNFKFSNSKIIDTYAPPFNDVNDFDYNYIAKIINESGAEIVWVSLGAPKQEIFMNNLIKHLDDSIVCLGVGAAFDFHAGTLKRAPLFFQKYGMEWFYRIFKEPRRLFLRYMYVNTKFVLLTFYTYIKNKKIN